MIEPMMATMLGFVTTDAESRAGAAPAGAEGRGRRHVQRDQRRRRVLDQRLRVRARERRERRHADRRRLSGAGRRAPAGLRAAGDRHRARRRGRHQADHDPGHRREDQRGRQGDGAGDCQLAAGEDRRARRRSELGPAGRGRRPGHANAGARSREDSHRIRSSCSATARRSTNARPRRRRTCRARRSTFTSIWARAEPAKHGCGRAI